MPTMMETAMEALPLLLVSFVSFQGELDLDLKIC